MANGLQKLMQLGKSSKNPSIEKWVKHKNEQGASIDFHTPEFVGFSLSRVANMI